MNYSKSSALKRVRTIADYQFGAGAGESIFPDDCEFGFSRTGRIRYVFVGEIRLATVRAGDGRLTLSYEGAQRLKGALPAPASRVVIDENVVEFVGKGKNAMAKHVTAADQEIRAGDEVLVVTPADDLVATGSAVLSGEEMLAFNYGVAVNVRKGRDTS